MLNIPHTCYLYWNNAPMSFLHTITLKSFHKYNPSWNIIVYNFKVPTEPSFAPKYKHYSGPDFFDKIRKWDFVEVKDIEMSEQSYHSILISDIWRREILYANGGLYSDFDMIWLKPIGHIEEVEHLGNWDEFNSLVCYYNYTEEFHNVSVLLSKQGNPFDKIIIDKQKDVKNYTYDDQAFGTTLMNYLYPKYEDIEVPGVVAVKYETFYPYSTYNLASLFLEDNLKAIENNNVLGVHWFNGNPLSKMFINNSLYKTKCSMNSILKREGYVEP